ncbi:MAG: NADPH-dependent reductase [Gemmatimonadetes bacterium]|jgi:NAD(P)H-dependent FMN reductase|nr:NADPH-dependent reductase [Gemmatimonadota bacterium]
MADAAPAARSIKLIAFAASLRRDSLNRLLLAQAVLAARAEGATVEVHDFREFIFPAYDGDMQASAGIPEPVQHLGRLVTASDGLLLSSPEYNYSVPGNLKNTIDWLSRIRPYVVQDRWALLLSASNGRVGGNRGLWHLRVPLESMGMMIFPDMFSLALAAEAFAEDGTLRDAALRDRLGAVMHRFVSAVGRARA